MNPHFLPIILSLAMAVACFSMGCSSIPPVNEDRAHQLADWVKNQSGLIEDGVAAIIRYEVYNVPLGTDRDQIINQIHVGAGSLQLILSNKGEFDADTLRQSLKINDQWVTPAMEAVAALLGNSINEFKKNGYGDLASEVLTAALKGIADGTAQ